MEIYQVFHSPKTKMTLRKYLQKISATFNFSNTGENPLIITEVKTSGGWYRT